MKYSILDLMELMFLAAIISVGSRWTYYQWEELAADGVTPFDVATIAFPVSFLFFLACGAVATFAERASVKERAT